MMNSEIPSSVLALAREQRNAQKIRAQRRRGLSRQACKKSVPNNTYRWRNKRSNLARKKHIKSKIDRLEMMLDLKL